MFTWKSLKKRNWIDVQSDYQDIVSTEPDSIFDTDPFKKMPFTGVQRLPVVNLNQLQSEQSDKQMKLLLVSPDACCECNVTNCVWLLQSEVTWHMETLSL